MTFICFILLSVLGTITSELVTVQDGVLKGVLAKSKNNNDYRRFLGIPYAEPPLRELRFQPPVPKKPWSGVHDAKNFGPICYQPVFASRDSFSITRTAGQEDCLYLNVFTPDINQIRRYGFAAKIPVIVFIHEGGFIYRSGNVNPDYFMDENVILVTMNYRLGVIGFLSMNNDYISGNFGLKDQALAMQWVKRNIAAFGGDPDNITLMGQSVGAASTHLHMFSPLSTGLFHKAILQSGSAYAPWICYDEAHTKALTTAFLVITGCFDENPAHSLKCLQHIPIEELRLAGNKLFVWEYDPIVLFRATIESNVTNQPFLPRKPSTESYVTKDIPWIIGINSGEGGFKALAYTENDPPQLEYIDKNRNRTIPLINQYLYTANRDNIDTITQKIINRYFGKNPIQLNSINKVVEMITDSHFVLPAMRTILSSYGPSYVYFYNYTASFQEYKTSGAWHSYELPMLFRDETIESKRSPMDEQISKTLLYFWINFVTHSDLKSYSNQTTWKPVQSDAIEYLHISNEGITMEKNFMMERYEFWDSLPLEK